MVQFKETIALNAPTVGSANVGDWEDPYIKVTDMETHMLAEVNGAVHATSPLKNIKIGSITSPLMRPRTRVRGVDCEIHPNGDIISLVTNSDGYYTIAALYTFPKVRA